MTEDFDFSTGRPASDMGQFLQLFLDETAEQLDALVEALLVLEGSPTDSDQLNEAFRLIHSIKGSAAMMGLDSITVLTHHLENHFERLRSGLIVLDQASMSLILRCIDFLRECNNLLRAGRPLSSEPELLEELNLLSTTAPESRTPSVEQAQDTTSRSIAPATATESPGGGSHIQETMPVRPTRDYCLLVSFEPDLPLVELKAELIVARLSELGSVRDTQPQRSQFDVQSGLRWLQVLLSTDRSAAELRTAADVDGVELIEVAEGGALITPTEIQETSVASRTADASTSPESPDSPTELPEVSASAATVENDPVPGSADDDEVWEAASSPQTAAAAVPKSKVAETVRVEIERLDNLMNLAGELVVNKARFVQITRQMRPAFRKSNLSSRARAFGEAIRRALQLMKVQMGEGEGSSAFNWHEELHELESEIDVLEEQSHLWETSRRCFVQITEAIDQMARVSDSLQRGVLDTRMVPVAPLFTRFKRVVRDISVELHKKINLEIRGEKTELDKRMIDELGDPLVHLIRNAIDHGIEPADVRARRGKPEIGTIALNAVHSGNSVLISVRDDGGGIPVEKVRKRIVDRDLVPAAVAEGMSEQEVIEHIWHPGFSTADVVSDISGRGVGMDIVKTRIAELNGTIDIEHAVGRGTTFTIRLPLTLAIIRSLLFRLRHGSFAVPIDNVREIVSVPVDQILAIHGKRTFVVRGEFIPLVDIDEIFEWHKTEYRYPGDREFVETADARHVNVVILQAAEKTMGLRVDELQGGQDIVIKSLAENFIHLRGLSGASILGDGSVCLLLDVAAAIALGSDPRKRN